MRYHAHNASPNLARYAGKSELRDASRITGHGWQLATHWQFIIG
jgi:hypothetical protein